MLPLALYAALVLAQNPPQALQLAPGRELRASTSAGTLQGVLLQAPPGLLRLQTAEGDVQEALLSDVRRLEVRHGAVPAGALYGAATAGWLGGGLGTAVCMLANAMRESGEPLRIPLCTLVGTAVAGTVGGAAGALVGTAVHSWPDAYAAPGATLQLGYGAPETPLPRSRSGVELGLGLGLMLGSPYAAPMVGARTRLHLLWPVTDALALGPEGSFGQLDHFVTRQYATFSERDEEITQAFADVGLRARYWLGAPDRALRPLLSAGLVLQSISVDEQPVGSDTTFSAEDTMLAASVGAGLDWVPVPGAPGFTLELAWRRGLPESFPALNTLELSVTSALRF